MKFSKINEIDEIKVSKPVILHEEADDVSEIPDLSYPVSVVKKAAENLIKVINKII